MKVQQFSDTGFRSALPEVIVLGDVSKDTRGYIMGLWFEDGPPPWVYIVPWQ